MKQLKYTFIMPILIFSLISSTSAAPEITVNNETFDFGFVPQKAKLSHTFWIGSSGTDVLKILKVVPGCGCTKAPLASNEIAPGDSTSLEIIFSTKSYRNKVSKRPKIYSNASDTEERVSFSAFVVSDQSSTLPITISPFAINQSHFDLDDNSVTFVISNQSEEELAISLVDYPRDVLKVILPEKLHPNASAQGKIVVHKDFKNVSFEKSVTIELDNKEKSRFTIPISHAIKKLSSK